MPIKYKNHRITNRLDKNINSPWHIMTKSKNIQSKENVKNCKGKDEVTYNCRSNRMIPDFSVETLKAKRTWTDVLQTLRDNRGDT